MTSFARLDIAGLIEVTPDKHGDHRGFFSEVFKRSDFEAEGISIDWIQDNQSYSATAGTIRGLHFQLPPLAQHKLIRVLRGSIFDVVVDIRRGSPTFAKWAGRTLSSANWRQLLVPIGLAHGFMTIEPDTEVMYKVSAPWSREHERTIRWDDPALGIEWPRMGTTPTLTDKDRDAPTLAEFDSPFVYRG